MESHTLFISQNISQYSKDADFSQITKQIYCKSNQISAQFFGRDRQECFKYI